MPTRAGARSGVSRRANRRKANVAQRTGPTRTFAPEANEPEEWIEEDAEQGRLDEGEMEMLLTGHAATHGDEGEDNWLIDSDQEKWSGR